MYKKITHKIFEEQFDQEPAKVTSDEYYFENEADVIKLNVPLLIRLLEWAREDASKDCDLHEVAERLIELSSYGDVLDMEYYDDIVDYKEGKKNV